MGEVIMQVTDVRVRRIEKEGKMKAIVSITLDNEFVIHDIKVIEGEKGLFIAMPSRKAADGEYRDIAHPHQFRNTGHDPESDPRQVRDDHTGGSARQFSSPGNLSGVIS